MSPSSAPFNSEASFRQAIDTVIAASEREIRVFDQALLRVPLEDKTRCEALGRFLTAAPGRRLRIIVHATDHLERRCPRLRALARRHSNAVEFRQSPEELRHLAEAYLLGDDAQAALRFHVSQPRGKIVLGDEETVFPWRQRFEELWALSLPCLPASYLGL